MVYKIQYTISYSMAQCVTWLYDCGALSYTLYTYVHIKFTRIRASFVWWLCYVCMCTCIPLATAIRCYRFFFSFSPLFNSLLAKTQSIQSIEHRWTILLCFVPFCGGWFHKFNNSNNKSVEREKKKYSKVNIWNLLNSENWCLFI